MALVSDQHIANLLALSDRLYHRINDWFDSTDETDDRAMKVPDERVRTCIQQVKSIVLEVAKLDIDRQRVAIQARNKGGQQLTDEQYQAEMVKLRQEILSELSSFDLAKEIDRREQMS